jgi:hypothetical protein
MELFVQTISLIVYQTKLQLGKIGLQTKAGHSKKQYMRPPINLDTRKKQLLELLRHFIGSCHEPFNESCIATTRSVRQLQIRDAQF